MKIKYLREANIYFTHISLLHNKKAYKQDTQVLLQYLNCVLSDSYYQEEPERWNNKWKHRVKKGSGLSIPIVLKALLLDYGLSHKEIKAMSYEEQLSYVYLFIGE